MKQVKDHLGITYPSIKAMCEAYGITRSAYNNRKRIGWSLEDILIGKDKRITDIEKKKKLEQKQHYFKEYYKNNKEDIKAASRAYKIANREKVNEYQKEYQRKYYEKNREKINKYQKEYRERKNGPLKEREKRCQDHLGITYPSVKAMCEAYGITRNTYDSRKRLGWPLKNILTSIKPKRLMDHLGNEYSTLSEMCEAYSITEQTFCRRRKAGWDLESILVGSNSRIVRDHLGNRFSNNTEMFKAYGVTLSTFYARKNKGWSLEGCLTGKNVKSQRFDQKYAAKECQDHLGITYPSVKAMCEAYGITRSAYEKRKENGWDLQDILIGKDKRITNIEKKKMLEQKQHYSKEYYKNNKELYIQYYENNKEDIKAASRAYKKANREKINEYAKEYQRKYYETNREKVLQWQKEYKERKNGRPLKEREKRCKDHLGITYPSVKAMCEAYGITRITYDSRKRLGWSLQDILTKPVRINKTDNN